MQDHLAYIRSLFDHTDLTPKQVARVLHGEGKDTKKRIEQVRQDLDNGTLVPGLKKEPGKQWRVDAVQLAKALDARSRGQTWPADRPSSRQPDTPRKSRFKNPGQRLPRFMAEGSKQVWAEVLDEMLLLESENLRATLTGEVVDVPDRDPGETKIIF